MPARGGVDVSMEVSAGREVGGEPRESPTRKQEAASENVNQRSVAASRSACRRPVPIDCAAQAFLERHLRLVPEDLAGLPDIGLRVTHVARP
jgi:hypothetical protein